MILSYFCPTKMMKIYTDGSANPNPGPGGFGVLVLDNEEFFVYNIYTERSSKTTNNKEELKAILYALKTYGVNIFNEEFADIPIVYSDSAYAINTYSDWMWRWANNDWKKSDNTTPENLDIIMEYYNLWCEGYRIDLQKVKGHSNNKGNIIADALAQGKLKEEFK